ncbi:MAG TPA: rhomboid family intramembrane serine protease [Candidatus Dormibacteraeota bacterium]|jgi:membrane associated rhomboid family serine protease|nr:rhomboid family intramembrane serine protease [Candidatus Dormibacteraeota bacterium]
MATTAKWTEFPKFPVIAGTAVLAIAVTIAWWMKVDVGVLFETAGIRRGQLWRFFTSIFIHLDILHLLFNIWWLWIFGTRIERVFGHTKSALLVLLLALGSGSFDFALSHGGVGLSGVGYGFFGLLWVLSKRDERFRDALEPRTVALFVGWFFLCIFTTITGLYPVANVAHGAGALFGALLGIAITTPSLRILLAVITGFLCILGVVCSTVLRPYVNLSRSEGYEEAKWGYDALIEKRNGEAVGWLRDASRYQPKSPVIWFDLGIAYQSVGDSAAAKKAYQKAHELAPDNSEYSEAAKNIQ